MTCILCGSGRIRMSNDIRVSIIMPVYNGEKFVEKSIQSVLNQDYGRWELIIINDCSTDNTEEIIREFAINDNRIKILTNEKNSGVAESRNRGLISAKGKFVAFLDSDDLWLSKKLSKQVRFMEDTGCKFSYSNYYINNVDEKDSKKTSVEIYKVNKGFDARMNNSFKSLLMTNDIGCLTVMIERSCIKDYFFKNIGHEDYIFWLTILKDNDFEALNVNEKLSIYNKRSESISSGKAKAAKWQWNIYRKELKLSLLSSIYNFSLYTFNGVKKHI